MVTCILDEANYTTLCGISISIDVHVITLKEALDPRSEKHFNCVDCHKVLTNNQKHSKPE